MTLLKSLIIENMILYIYFSITYNPNCKTRLGFLDERWYLKNKLFNKVLNSGKLKTIESLFDAKFKQSESSFSLNIKHVKSKTEINLELFPDSVNSILVSVYTSNCHLQLQNCDNIIASKMLEEILFLSKCGKLLSGLIISKHGDCSLYSNIKISSLKQDFTNLNSEKLISAVALSVAETLY